MSICLLLPAGASRAGDQVPFKATFHGFATSVTPTADPDVFVIVVPLAGQATHLGRFDELLTHYFNFATGSFVGFTQFTAADGSTFRTVFSGQAYPDPNNPGWITFDVHHTIVDGTGRFAGATGRFDGVNGRFDLVTLEDLGGYEGTISSPGANKK
jgi:hypothetical protein